MASAGKDPLTGRYLQVHRRFHGTLQEAKVARAASVPEVKQGRHGWTTATVDELCVEWLKELERKDRSPRTIDEYRRCYHHDIQPSLGTVRVSKVTTKMLTDLYGAHQKRGQSPGSVRRMHTTISSMMGQACRWGWREDNPAEWAEPPPLGNAVPVVPTPEEVALLTEAARKSRRPEHADIFYFSATTGVRRGELCAIRSSRVDWEQSAVEIARSSVKQNGAKLERPTKNRRLRLIAIDDRCLAILQAELDKSKERAAEARTTLVDDPYIFTISVRGEKPWDPDTISQYFARLRKRAGLDHLEFKGLRRFMDTYGQELGFSMAQVAMRAGHDPAVAGRHYTGRVVQVDRDLASAIGHLLE